MPEQFGQTIIKILLSILLTPNGWVAVVRLSKLDTLEILLAVKLCRLVIGKQHN